MDKIDDNLVKHEIMGDKEVEKCHCHELKARSLKAEAKCIELESEIKKWQMKFEALEAKFKELESEKVSAENELKNLKQSKPVPGNMVDLTVLDEEDPIVELEMVNKALECEKQVAETEAKIWKGKFEKLLAAVRKLKEMGALRDGEWLRDEDVVLGLELAGIKLPKEPEFNIVHKLASSGEGLVSQQSLGSPYTVTPAKVDNIGRSRCTVSQPVVSSRGRVRKVLSFEDDGNNVGLSTPANGKPASMPVIDLCDSDEEPGDAALHDSNGYRIKSDYSREKESGSGNYEDDDDDVDASEANTTHVPARKRRRVVRSDSESDDEDNIPISILKGLRPSKQGALPLNDDNGVSTTATDEGFSGRRVRHRRVLSRQVSSEPVTKERLVGIPTTDNVEDDESEEVSESASESLDGFIVDDDEESDTDGPDESRSGESSTDSPDESDEDIGYAGLISRLRRDKNPGNWKWEYEGDMLADFGKDPELCMRAVCALYRQQTEDEKESKSTHYWNNRGFSKFDAQRGSRLGEFLTDGDPCGDLKKTMEELRRFDAEAVELCRVLATHYSKQLFQIYKNKEDPFFTSP